MKWPNVAPDDDHRCGCRTMIGFGEAVMKPDNAAYVRCSLEDGHGANHSYQMSDTRFGLTVSVSWEEPRLCGQLGPNVVCWLPRDHRGLHRGLWNMPGVGPKDVQWE